MINWPTSVEHALESRFGPVATRSKKAPERRRANGAASDHKEGHGQEEADDAADEAPNAVIDKHHQRVHVKERPITLGSMKFPIARSEARTTTTMTAALLEPLSPRAR
jgi:hypothetical protein